MGLLPVHAAGHHTSDLGRRARPAHGDRPGHLLLDANHPLPALRPPAPSVRSGGGRALIVAMPVTPALPGGGALPNVPAEVARVRALLPDTVLLPEPGDQLVELLRRSPPGPTCSGSSRTVRSRTSPATATATAATRRRACCCSTTTTAPLTVASLAPVDLGRAELAFLSACGTALTSTGGLIDEAGPPHHSVPAGRLPPRHRHPLGNQRPARRHRCREFPIRPCCTSQGAVNTGRPRRPSMKRSAPPANGIQLPRSPSLWGAYLHSGA